MLVSAGDALLWRGRDLRRAVWATFAVLGLLLVGYLISLLARPNGAYSLWLDGWLIVAVELVASGLCIARASSERRAGRSPSRWDSRSSPGASATSR